MGNNKGPANGLLWTHSVYRNLPPARQAGANGLPFVDYVIPGMNALGTAGPFVTASVNGLGPRGSVFLGTGAAYIRQTDAYLRLNGIEWYHERIYSSKSNYAGTEWAGEGWWVNEMMNLSVEGDEGESDVTVQFDPHYTFNFTYADSAWTCDDKFLFTLTFSSGSNEYRMRRLDGFLWVFHDSEVANVAGRLKEIQDPFGSTWTFNYSGAQLSNIVIDVVEGADHKITYSYFSGGDNDGLLQYVKVFNDTAAADTNLVRKVEYVYHGSGTDAYGVEDDLMKVIVTRLATADTAPTLSIEETYSYRYYKGAYDADTNPGTDHQLRFVLLPENRQRLTDGVGSPESQTNDVWEDYANIFYKYDSNSRVKFTDERLPGGSCGCGAGGNAATTTYTWSVNGSSTDADTWKVHCVADRENGTRVIFDANRLFQILTWVVQDDDDGSPTIENIWHFDYGTGGDTENRLTAVYLPSACSAYDENSPYSVTLNSGSGVVYTTEYDTSTYAGFPKKHRIKKGTGGAADTLTEYARSISERPDLVTTVTAYESGSEADGRATTIAYTFYDGPKHQLKQLTVTNPVVSTAKNGPNVGAVQEAYFDKRTGALRWRMDGEGYVNYYAYDTVIGAPILRVLDADTSTLLTAIDNTWDGVTHGGLGSDDAVPFSRFGAGAALQLATSREFDGVGRARKTVDPEGTTNFIVYKDDETRAYSVWTTPALLCLLPIQIVTTDKEGRPENIVTLLNSVTPGTDGNDEPDGTEVYGNSDMATRTINAYNISGMLETSDRYHDIPSSGLGTRYTNYYRTKLEYDGMGHLEYRIEDVNDESDYDREQVAEFEYDFLGRLITSKEAVSDSSHDIGGVKPTMVTTAEYFHDDPDSDSTPERGGGDGNLHWVRRWWGAGGSDYNDTEMRYDWRNRRCLTVNPAAPHTLVKYDNLDRVTVAGTYTATTNLDPGDDPSTTENGNRADLSKTSFDEWGRVYKTESYDDPGDATPADALVSNTYYDRRSLVWASDPPNSGVSFVQYDGAGRMTASFLGTQFDSAKYTSNVPDYPDDNEGIVQHTAYTLNDTGEVEQVVTKELNHNDTNGMDLDGSDFIRTYVYHWYDGGHRLTDTANYGTNNNDGWKDNSSAPSYGASAPSRSDTVLVTTYTYDTAGRRSKVTDPRGLETAYTFDDLGRVTSMDENDGGADERITLYTYNGLNSLVTIAANVATDQVTAYMYENAQNARWVSKIKYPATDTANSKVLGQPSDETYDRITFTYNKDGTLATRTDQNGTVLTWTYDALRRKTEEEVTTVGSYSGGTGSVASAVRAVTWTYTSDGLTEFVTTHSDTTPDTSTWTDAVNQVKYTYDAANRLIEEEQEYDGAVDGSTLSVQYAYGTNYSTGNYARLNKLTYPNGKVLWNGYTHTDTSNTFEDTINDTFSRVGQLAFDNAGSIGNIIAEYSFNGMSRMAIRNHDNDSGWTGNDLKLDYFQGSSGTYAGLDRFGRVIDQRFIRYPSGGLETNQTRLQYAHDRDSNRTTIERSLHPSWSQELAYDNLNRLTKAEVGYLETGAAQLSDVSREWFLDELGNINESDGLKINGVSAVLKHATNETNEITSLIQANVIGGPSIINDPFTDDALNGLWAVSKGTASLTSTADKLVFTALDGTTSTGVLVADDPTACGGTLTVKVKAGHDSTRAGIVFAHNGINSFYAVVLNRNTDALELYQYSSGSWGSALDASSSASSDNSTEYELRVEVRQRQVAASLWDGSNRKAFFKYNGSSMLGTGKIGVVTDNTNAVFDDFKFFRPTPYDPAVPGWNTSSAVTLTTGSPGYLTVTGQTRGGEVVSTWCGDDDYAAQTDLSFVAGNRVALLVRYIDPDNFMGVELRDNGTVNLIKMLDGRQTTVASGSYSGSSPYTTYVRCSGTSYVVRVEGTQAISTTDADIAHGTVGLWAERSGKFEAVKAGVDSAPDGDLDDAADTLVIYDTFTGTSKAFAYDDAGNLVEDDRHRYQYDAWNRLVLVQRIAADANGTDATTLHAAEYDGLGRRIEKVVSNCGDLDGTFRYGYNGQQMIERRDGSSNVLTQAYYGTQYIDELVALKLEHGYAVVSQDANYNVTTLTDLAGRVLERVFTTEYGQPILESDSYFGDYDADGDVDATDDSYLGSGQTCWGTATGACRVFDFNGDGTLDASDETVMTALVSAPTTNRIHHARRTSPAGNLFLHQGLVYDPEIAAYQNRAREYDPVNQRFHSHDPYGYDSYLSLYEYLGANPIVRNDPSGLGWVCCQNLAPMGLQSTYKWIRCDLQNVPDRKMARQRCCQKAGLFSSAAPSPKCGLLPRVRIKGHGSGGSVLTDDEGNLLGPLDIKEYCAILEYGGTIDFLACNFTSQQAQELISQCREAAEVCYCTGIVEENVWGHTWCTGDWVCEPATGNKPPPPTNNP
ncbi:MAG: RHS repeat-associated core domain-containing protein [Planctomycetia bacterium]|nr:RHS repeat-associated core domain-containing protein [Planctomycetia bacterium]